MYQNIFIQRSFQGNGNRPENCVHIYPDGKWNNALCEESRGYICAGPVPEEGNTLKCLQLFRNKRLLFTEKKKYGQLKSKLYLFQLIFVRQIHVKMEDPATTI